MSTFVKKNIVVDENLSKILGYEKGRLISYAEITKGIYDYVKEHPRCTWQGLAPRTILRS